MKKGKKAKGRTLGDTTVFRDRKRGQQRRPRRSSQRWRKSPELWGPEEERTGVIVSVLFLEIRLILFGVEEVVVLCLSGPIRFSLFDLPQPDCVLTSDCDTICTLLTHRQF